MMVQLKPRMNNYKDEVLGMVAEFDKKRVNLIFDEICTFITTLYVPKDTMNCCIRAKEKVHCDNKLLKKTISGYKLLIKRLNLAGINCSQNEEDV